MTETGIYTVRRGDSAHRTAQKLLIRSGMKLTAENINMKLQELVELNHCEDVEDFNRKFFSSVGLEISIKGTDVKKPKPQGATTASEEPDATPIGNQSDRKPVSELNNVDKIKSDITKAGGKPVVVTMDKLPASMQTKVKSYTNLYQGTIPTFIKDDKTGDVYMYMNTLNTANGNKIKLQSLNIKMNNDETIITRYYRTGKIAQDIENNYNSNRNRSVLIQGAYRKPKTKKLITQALDINIEVNSDLYKKATPSQKKDIDEFLGGLKNQKAGLMQDLKIDNDTYNRFAKLAVAIGMQETKLGTATSYENWDGAASGTVIKDSVAVLNNGLKSIGIDNPISYKGLNSTAVSKGITQIKIADWIKTPHIKKLFNKYGITSGYYTNPTPEQTAAATIIVLNELSKRVQRPEFKDGISAANKKFYATSYEITPQGKGVKLSTEQWKLNRVTEDDAILYLYNGRAGVLKRGNATPKSNGYISSIRRNASCVKIYENGQDRAEALKNAKTVTIEESNPTTPNRNQLSMREDLGWGIGQIAFMPKVYSSGVENNTKQEIESLKATLKAKGVDITYIDKLAEKLENGDLAFVKGISRAEMSAMTEDDVKLLISHSDKLNEKLENIKTNTTKRKYAADADRNFKRAYLSSHAAQTSLSEVKRNSVKLNKASDKDNTIQYPEKGYYTGAQRRCKGLLPQLRGNRIPDAGLHNSNRRIRQGQYMGYKIENDAGINTANASALDILLAKNAADAANTLKTSGACLTGAKQALIGSGAFAPSELRGFNKAFELAKFLRNDPKKRFVEITHIQISPTMAREITAGDLSSLPAGCIVVYGNKSRADVFGHSGVTSGNGQIYADEIDNSNWDNFTSNDEAQDGKGEHGYISVFRLNPAYFTTDEAGKKLVPRK